MNAPTFTNMHLYDLKGYSFLEKEEQVPKHPSMREKLRVLEKQYRKAKKAKQVVEAVILIHLKNHPHILLFQVDNTYFKLPGETPLNALRRKLDRKLAPKGGRIEWDVL